MNKNIKQKGFTLMELLVTVVVLGVIVGLSIPIIRNIQLVQTEKRYNTYLDSVGYSAKLYTDSYSNDLFGDNTTGCQYVSYSELSRYKLLKDIDMKGISCNSDYIAVKVVKYVNKYYYKPFIGCGIEKNGKASNADIFRPSKLDINSVCMSGSNRLINIEGIPALDESLINKEYAPKIRLVSETGVSKDNQPRLFYGYSYNKDTNIIGDWQPVEFKIASKALQEKWIRELKTQTFTSTSTLPMPSGLTGDLYLVIRVDLLEDLSGYPWQSSGDNFAYVGPFRVDNEAPSFNDSTIKSSAGEYQSKRPKLNFHVTDEHFSTESDLKICYSYDTEQRCPIPNSNADLTRMTEYKDYNPNQVLKKISNEYNGTSHKIYVTVSDAAGNTASQEFDYRVASSYKLTFDKTEGSACDHDYIYQIENKPWTAEVVDEEGFNTKAFCKTKRTGYTLNGWYTQPNGQGTQVKTTDLATADLKVYANWKINTYKLTYNVNGGSGCTSKTVAYNAAYGTLCTPTRTGYTFTGWYTAASGGTQVNSNTKMGAGNTTIYAQWRINQVIVTLKSPSGETLTATTTSGSTTNTWSKTSDYMINRNGSLYKQVISRGTSSAMDLANYNYSEWLNITKSGYVGVSGAEWKCISGCKTSGQTFTHNATTVNTQNICNTDSGDCTIVLQVNWVPTYTITYSANGGSGTTAATTCASGASCTLRGNSFSRSGYSFAGWYTAASGGSKYGATTTLSGNITVYAHWAITSQSFSYTGGGQSYKATATGTYKLEVWGAQGGIGKRNGSNKTGGNGGYSYGNITLSENQTIYVVVGGKGGTVSGCTGGSGGYNGGGKGGNDSNCSNSGDDAGGGGGGATHIGKTNSLLKNTTAANIIIVAGGGGGGGYWGGKPTTSTKNCPGPGGSGYIGGVSGGSTTANNHAGNGSAKITFVSA